MKLVDVGPVTFNYESSNGRKIGFSIPGAILIWMFATMVAITGLGWTIPAMADPGLDSPSITIPDDQGDEHGQGQGDGNAQSPGRGNDPSPDTTSGTTTSTQPSTSTTGSESTSTTSSSTSTTTTWPGPPFTFPTSTTTPTPCECAP